MSFSIPIARSRPRFLYLNSNCVTVRHTSSSTKPASATALSIDVPPESPKFIHIPQPPQQQATYRKLHKGVLPKPRRIFDSYRKDKTSSTYLASVTPDPKKEPFLKNLPKEQQDYNKYKTRQSDLRKKNLREGLVLLGQRKAEIDARIATRSSRKQRDYRRRISAPEREDERLTRPSIISELQIEKLRIDSDPQLDTIVKMKKGRYKAYTKQQLRERKNHLHSLYMQAGEFIVNEEQLEKKIKEEFDQPFYQRNPTRSIWDAEGIPETTAWMLHGDAGRSGAIDKKQQQADLSRERAQKIAEELTGGRI